MSNYARARTDETGKYSRFAHDGFSLRTEMSPGSSLEEMTRHIFSLTIHDHGIFSVRYLIDQDRPSRLIIYVKWKEGLAYNDPVVYRTGKHGLVEIETQIARYRDFKGAFYSRDIRNMRHEDDNE
jgi:hypothetical protein